MTTANTSRWSAEIMLRLWKHHLSIVQYSNSSTDISMDGQTTQVKLSRQAPDLNGLAYARNGRAHSGIEIFEED
ncbi:uncharacterized protein N7487_010298 [Penicillium crustosum]|uniref:uncharacterized protein n=1 Tax=Penicillium crustosum TaxID=36656 RepID=UPI002390DB57|nr:uncharacterized protein N7487_010298 [Penicillium crustosum]KAJ5395995.1 hypothetical protein N7487_010298 [Penicillium crustosum]